MITITAVKWAPPFAAGNVLDHRLRWILNEVGWCYEVRLVDAAEMASPAYRAGHPFGQVPFLEEDGRPTLFETGAVVIDIASRAARLIPPDGDDRALVVTWGVAALNSVDSFLMNVAEVEYFLEDAAQQAARRPLVHAVAAQRLEQLHVALGDRRWLVGDGFTIADLMMASVLNIARNLGLFDSLPALAAYQVRRLDRPGYRQAIAQQCAEIAQHEMADMKYPHTEKHDG